MSAAPIVALGAGRMGRGIAQVFATAGYRVDVIDFRPREAAARTRLLREAGEAVRGTLGMLAAHGAMSEADAAAIHARIRFLACEEAPAALAGAGVVFEGVTETLEAKRDALARAAPHLRDEAIVASTTSSLPADALAALAPRAERFVNAHFLNPAYLIPLVELSPARATTPETFEAVRALLESAGKVVVRCAPSPGYIVPRLQAAAMNEAARLVEEGVASPEDIDRAVRAGFGPRYAAMGICEFIDWGGVDILYHASRAMAEALDAPRYAPPAIVARLMEDGRRGAREGEGFYDWRARDLDAYHRELIGRFVALFRQLDLLPRPQAARD